MTYTAQITKTAEVKGEYKNTGLDERKAKADFLIQAIDGNWYTLWLNKDITIKAGRSVKRITDRVVCVTERVKAQLCEQYNWATDF